MIVLDTNVVSEASKPVPDSNVSAWFRKQDFLELYMCGAVIMEQSFGAERFLNKTGSDRYVRVLDHLMNPDLAVLMLVVGGLLIYLEFNAPGTIVPGALGTDRAFRSGVTS